MDGLRLILLLVGALIVGLVWWSTRTRPPGRVRSMPEGPTARGDLRAGPSVQGEDDPERTTPAQASLEVKTRPAQSGFDPDRQMIVAMYVMPAAGQQFLGADVLDALDDAGLKYGRRQVFHRLHRDQTSATVFHVANMVEPGAFDLKAMPQAWIPGLTFFMVLPGVQDGVGALADMLATARRVAARLHGEVKDADRSTLTKQTAQHLRERVVAFQHRMDKLGSVP